MKERTLDASERHDPAARNRLLASLPPTEVTELRANLRRVSLAPQQVLQEPGCPINEVFFIDTGVSSLLGELDGDRHVAFGLIGSDGLVGVTAALNSEAVAGHRAFVQVPGSAFRMDAAALRASMARLPVLRGGCLRYAQLMIEQTGQIAACNARHTLSERLALWLLMLRDQLGQDELLVTQAFLSQMLGVRRGGVSMAANRLKDAGLIQQLRGRVRIVNRSGLQRVCCGCYRVIERSRRRILGDPPD